MDQNQQNQKPIKHLYRSIKNRILFGVCGGLGEYFNIDPIVIRIVFLALTLGAGSGILLYIILALVVPKPPESQSQEENISGPADLKNRVENLASELRETGFSDTRKAWLGVAIIILGFMLLLDQILPSHFFKWGFFWAGLIILLGLYILTRGKKSIEIKDNKQAQQPDLTMMSEKIKEATREAKKEIRKPRQGCCFGAGRLFFGLLLLLIGFAFLAQNLGWISGINFNLTYLWKIWPVFIILAGLSLLSRGTWVGAVLAVIVALALIILIAFSLFVPAGFPKMQTYNFNIPKDISAEKAEIYIQAGASYVQISKAVEGFASGTLKSNVAVLKTESKTQGNIQKVKITMDGNVKKFSGQLLVNELAVYIAENIPLDLNIDSGASKLDLDLSALSASNIKLHAGASTLNLILGDILDQSVCEIDAGVSSINISLPRTLGARIIVKDALGAKNFPDFNQISDNVYESVNYSQTQKKININFKAGISQISINWR